MMWLSSAECVVMQQNGFFFSVCCRSGAAKHEGRAGEKATSIRGLIYSDYKWLPSVGADQRLRPVLRLKSSRKHTERRFFYSPRPESESSRPRAAGHSGAAESFYGPEKPLLLCFFERSTGDGKKRMIMSLSFLSGKVGGFFWSWPHVETTSAVLVVAENENDEILFCLFLHVLDLFKGPDLWFL